MGRVRSVLLVLLATVCVGTATAHGATPARPEDPGAFGVRRETVLVHLPVDPQSPDGAIPFVQTDVYAPAAAGRWPVVLISHGFCNTKADFVDWGLRLASRGFVVVVPTRRAAVEAMVLHGLGITQPEAFPVTGTVSGTCADLDSHMNAEDALRVLRWTIGEDKAPGFLHRSLDARRLALVGHSQGGLVAADAAALSLREGPHLSAIVLMDNAGFFGVPDDKTAMEAAAHFTAPTAVIASQDAQAPARCEIGTRPDCVLAPTATFAALPRTLPRLGLRVVGALHGEAEDPDNDDGAAANPARQRMFQRYAVAWLECWVAHDHTAAPYLNGAASDRDATAGRIKLFARSPRMAASGGC